MSELAAKVQFHGKPGTIPQDLCRAQNISAEAKTIFALLTTYKEAFPGQQWLADHVPCSPPTVRSRLRELELHGWIKRDRRNRRAKETDLYHVYMSMPLPASKRADWVVGLGLTGDEVAALPKGDYGKDITVKRLPKRDCDKRVKGSAVRSSSDGKTNSSADKPRFPAEWYRELEAAYQETKGIVLSGPEFGPLQRDLKLIFRAGHEPQTVREFMAALEHSDEAWTDGWTIKTVRMKLAEWVGGKLKLGGNGKPTNPEADAIRADIRQQEAAISALDRELTRLEYVVHPVESITRREQPAPTPEQLDRFDELKDLKAEKERDLGRLRKQLEVVR